MEYTFFAKIPQITYKKMISDEIFSIKKWTAARLSRSAKNIGLMYCNKQSDYYELAGLVKIKPNSENINFFIKRTDIEFFNNNLGGL